MEPLRCKVILLGDGKVGKTCLQYCFANGLEYLAKHKDYRMTALDNYELLLPINDSDGEAATAEATSTTPSAVRMCLWDTAGQEEFDELRRMCYTSTAPSVPGSGNGTGGPGRNGELRMLPSPLQCDVSVFILCFAWDDPHSLTSVQMRWYREIRRVEHDGGFLKSTGSNRPFKVILCGTKFDLRVDADKLGNTDGMVTREQAYMVQQSIGADALVVCSSKTGFGVRDVFHTALLLWLQEQPPYMSEAAANPRDALTLSEEDIVSHPPCVRETKKQSFQLL